MRRTAFVVLIASAGFIALLVPQRLEATDFYMGKTVEILAHAPPGGSYDLHSRLLARHMKNHLPGQPTMIVKNIPGGGGLVQANFLFQRGKRDGTTIGLLASGVPQTEALGIPGVQYESRRYMWIGLISDTVNVIVSRRGAPIQNLADLLDPKKEPLIFGAAAPPSNLYVIPAGLNLVFERTVGRPLFKLITGYGGVGPLRPALERGEVDGFSWTWDGLKSTAPHYLEPAPGKGFINLIGHVSLSKNQELVELGVPFIPDRLKNARDRAILDFLAAPAQTQWAVAAPPGIPQERLKVLRQAFMKTVADPAYLADTSRLNLTVNPLTGDEVEKIVRAVLETPKDVVDIARGIFGK